MISPAGRSRALLLLLLLLLLPLFPQWTQFGSAANAPKDENVDEDEDKKRFNLVAICTDDQARWAMSAYGNPDLETPHMDRIAREGALLVNAFCNTPVCSPSRATYLTGRYATELGITDWISPMEAEQGLGLDAPTWAQALQDAGYATALVGKWHLGDRERFHPTRLGFDHFTGFLGGGTKPMDAEIEMDGELVRTEGALPDVLVSDAIAWMDERSEVKEPFALCLHFRAPHTAYLPVPEVDRAPYRELEPTFLPDLPGLDLAHTRQQHRDYYSSVASVDRNIGRLLDALDEMELTENTIVVFTSDHGYNLGRHYISTKGNGFWLGGGRIPGAPNRPNLWDHSVRVPGALRWPGVIEPGTRIEQSFSFVDLYRTVLGMLELPIPAGVAPRGRDFSPVLRGEPASPGGAEAGEAIVFAQYDHHNSGLAYLRMARSERYKYVRHYHANYQDEFYDLVEDAEEMKNLLGRRARLGEEQERALEQLKDAMARWMRQIDDPLLKDSY